VGGSLTMTSYAIGQDRASPPQPAIIDQGSRLA
jgi:hypothetical protein